MPRKERRVLPTLSQVQEAADTLPDPDTFRGESCEASPESWRGKMSLAFTRAAFRSRTGKKIHRWVYEGKIMVRSKSGELENSSFF